jgi:acetyltransferase-like isoleucine patch superfamily enzyme
VASRTIPGDWYPGTVPEGVILGDGAYVETSYSFRHFRATARDAVRFGAGASAYLGTMFDVGPRGRVRIGEYALLHGVWFVCDGEVAVGDHALLSWNVVLMDTYRVPEDPAARGRELALLAGRVLRRPDAGGVPRPVRIGARAWLGFDVCVLPGVSIGDGSIVGARSVVFDDVPPNSIAAGNPARVVRALTSEELARGR